MSSPASISTQRLSQKARDDACAAFSVAVAIPSWGGAIGVRGITSRAGATLSTSLLSATGDTAYGVCKGSEHGRKEGNEGQGNISSVAKETCEVLASAAEFVSSLILLPAGSGGGSGNSSGGDSLEQMLSDEPLIGKAASLSKTHSRRCFDTGGADMNVEIFACLQTGLPTIFILSSCLVDRLNVWYRL